jgi:hypothetical protein
MIKGDTIFTDMQIDIAIEDLGVPEPPAAPQVQQVQRPLQERTVTSKPTEKDSGNKKIKYIFGGLVIVIGACILYYFWMQSKKKVADVAVAPSVTDPVAPLLHSPSVIEEVSLPKSISTSEVSKPTFSFY